MNLLKYHPYSYLFFSGIVNGIGDRFSQVAVLTLVLHITGSGLAVGAVLGIRILPFLLLAPLGGKLADRLNKKCLLMATDLLRIPFALSFLFVKSKEDLWIVFVGVIALSCGEAFYLPVRKSTIAEITDKTILIKVNGMEQLILGIVLIGGSITGGVVAFLLGNQFAFVLNACSFLAAALLIRKLSVKNKSQTLVESRVARGSFSKGISIFVIVAVILQTITATMDGVFNVLISVYGAQTFKLDELGVGLLYGSLGTGLIFSFLVTGRLTKNFLLIGMVALIAESIFQIVASQVDNFLQLSLLFVSISFIGGVGGASVDTLIMQQIPKGKQGRVFGLIEAILNIQIGLVMFGTGIILENVHAQKAGWIGGSIGLVGAVLLLIIYGLILMSYRNNESVG
ncbi:MFS transporter [Halobacillus mangrovi]|uniref:MFS transporter n=1 Tax=Halobacillus mangrovi TaxID=402384 RepID=UPI003D953F77